MQVGPDGNSPSCLAHLPFWEDEVRLAPSMPTLCSLAPLVLPTALSTSQVFHKLQLSKPPTPWSSFTGGSGEGAFSSSSEFLAEPLRKQVTSGPNSGGSSQSGSFGSHCFSASL